MRFAIKENHDDFVNGSYAIDKDTMLTYSTFKAQFQLLLGEGYHVSLDVESETGKCIALYATLSALKFKNTDLQLDGYTKATLTFDCDKLQDGGCHYLPFENTCYCDTNRCVLAFGSIDANGRLYEISNDTFVKLQGEKLVAVFVSLNKEVFRRYKF